MTRADDIARAVLDEFARLPKNRMPVVRGNGVREWVPLSGIVAALSCGRLVCLALATGMKCLPASKLPVSRGVGIHDWHAEVLALRAFNRFVLQECQDVLLAGQDSDFLRIRGPEETSPSPANNDDKALEPGNVWNGQPFAWNDDVALHMYCSEAPCGDASMELTMAAQEDASPWALPSNGTAASAEPDSVQLLGRGYFSRLGTVRRKPGRGDALPTLSKSCSDKLALRQCTSLLSGLASLLVAPSSGLYLRSVVLPTSQYSESGCRRCFSADEGVGRMHALRGRTWPGGYSFVPFAVQTTDLEFAFSKRTIAAAAAADTSGNIKTSSSNVSVAWTSHGVNECLVNGVLRGRKTFDPAGASAMSRRKMWRLAQEVAASLADEESVDSDKLQQAFTAKSYGNIKSGDLLAARAHVKESAKEEALRGWTQNTGDEDWGLEEDTVIRK